MRGWRGEWVEQVGGLSWSIRVKYGMIIYMKILAIESSCDETAAAVIGDGAEILSNVVVSQVDIFAVYGGVIPEVAARSHLEAILPVVHKALDDARLTKDDIDYIAVTYAPGLLGSLLIGTLTARMLAILWRKPLYAVHHLKSHIYANWLMTPGQNQRHVAQPVSRSKSNPLRGRDLEATHLGNVAQIAVDSAPDGMPQQHKCDFLNDKTVPEFPLLALVISGGHTQIIYMPGHNQFEIIGTTRDDAVGECFDKVAKILGLPYPGGPSITRCAHIGNPQVYKLPHPKVEGLDFSFSGLKTAVLRAVQAELGVPITTPSYELAGKLTEEQKSDFAAAFQDTACEILVEKVEEALKQHPEVKSLVVAGGVSANQVLREKTRSWAERMKKSGVATEDFQVYFPELKYAGDNAAMVGAAAYYEILSGVEPVDAYSLNILPRTPIK